MTSLVVVGAESHYSESLQLNDDPKVGKYPPFYVVDTESLKVVAGPHQWRGVAVLAKACMEVIE